MGNFTGVGGQADSNRQGLMIVIFWVIGIVAVDKERFAISVIKGNNLYL